MATRCDQEPDIVLCSYCQCALTPEADEAQEVLIEGIKAILCLVCYREYKAGTLGATAA